MLTRGSAYIEEQRLSDFTHRPCLIPESTLAAKPRWFKARNSREIDRYRRRDIKAVVGASSGSALLAGSPPAVRRYYLSQRPRTRKSCRRKRYGTSHVLAKDEAKLFERGCEQLTLCSGQIGNMHLSPEAEACFAKKGCNVVLQPTPKAILLTIRVFR